ncbi:hypothetical protein HS088_TW15G00127 [Tripterygium wilfordii]|uniref:Movement protein binding protein 2C n=1 Tax=Tripterygium wilfordii TaxID=458696 RepID=A0A7J7CKN5_TRIWF|nr:protein MICROTUBULE BINDING PROTEIN 2C-like [Tripterygium wilfordii]KAF5734635.1 hypothetical protein HS088_TW15G00127 [Tripterygium wilfordii]
MYDPQHYVDLQENSGFGDTKSWLSGQDDSSLTHLQNHSSLAANGDFDRVLFNNLVEMVPLVQSLIDRKTSSSFTRRGSMVYTKTPSRESLYRKVDSKGRNAAHSIPVKKKKDQGNLSKTVSNDHDADSFSIFSSRALTSEKDQDELVALREQVEDLQRKLLEKDELLKSAEISKNQMNDVQKRLDELKHLAAEKDSLIKSTQVQLSDAKIKLADKQAALEKLQWEATTSNRKVEKLQEELHSMQGEVSSFMLVFEGLAKDGSTAYSDDYDITPYRFDHLPRIDDLDDMEIQKMEEARKAYVAAVAAAKERQDEDSISAAARARLHLQSFLFRSQGMHSGSDFPRTEIP